MFKIFGFTPFGKNPWKVIETVVLQSPFSEIDDPLIIQIETRDNEYRKRVTKTIFEGSATEEDKNYYLTKFLLLVEYIDAVNARLFFGSFKDFDYLAEQHAGPDIEVIEDGEYVQLSDTSFISNYNKE